MTDIAAFIRRLLKSELHLDLEGAITPATLAELSSSSFLQFRWRGLGILSLA
jgi:hypothetical protein